MSNSESLVVWWCGARMCLHWHRNVDRIHDGDGVAVVVVARCEYALRLFIVQESLLIERICLHSALKIHLRCVYGIGLGTTCNASRTHLPMRECDTAYAKRGHARLKDNIGHGEQPNAATYMLQL